MRWSLWQIALPIIALRELIYVRRHPRTYRPRAILVGLPIAALSYALWIAGTKIDIIYLTQTAAVILYYMIKFREHGRARTHNTINKITS